MKTQTDRRTDGAAASASAQHSTLWAELSGAHRRRAGAAGATCSTPSWASCPRRRTCSSLLDEAPEQRLRMADVSAALRLSKSGVTRLVDRLAERGLVVRAPCPKDRRVVYAGLTDEGRATAAAAAPALAAGVAQQLAGRLSAERARRAHGVAARPAARTRRPAPDAGAPALTLHPDHPEHIMATRLDPPAEPPGSTPRRSTRAPTSATSTSRSPTSTARSRSTRACSASS